MICWIIYSRIDYEKNKEYVIMHMKACEKYGIELQLMFLEDFTYGVKEGKCFLYYGKEQNELVKPYFVIGRFREYHFSEHLEKMNIDVFNNSIVSHICNDKAKTYRFIKELGINVIKTYILKDITYIQEMIGCLKQEEVVLKSRDGHGGSEVYLINKADIPNINNHNKYIIQPFIENSNGDVRVYVLNGKIVGAVQRKAKNGFKSNYSLGGEIHSFKLNKEQENIVYKIINAFLDDKYINYYNAKYNEKHIYIRRNTKGLFYGGIDFILDENNNFIFNEIEDVVGSRMLYNTSSIDIVDEYINEIINIYQM